MSMMSKPIATQGTSKDVSDEWYVTVMRLPRELVRKPTKAPKPSSKLALAAWPPRSGMGLPICARQSEGCCATRIHLVVQLCPQETAHLSKHFRPIVEVNEELQDLPMHACVFADDAPSRSLLPPCKEDVLNTFKMESNYDDTEAAFLEEEEEAPGALRLYATGAGLAC